MITFCKGGRSIKKDD
jgi:hypothetical protein